MLKKLFVLSFIICSGFLFGQGSLEKKAIERLLLDSIFIHTKVDSIVNLGIQKKAFPGAQILVLKNGKQIFHKTYGYHTYDSLTTVSKTDMYDLASVTKITAALPAIMKLVDDGKLELDRPFSNYWKPWRRQKDKKNITLREILAHQAGLEPYIVFLKEVRKKDGSFKKRFIRVVPNRRFQKKVCDSIYVKNRFSRKVYRKINRSEVSDTKEYRYSGLTFLIFPKVVEQISGLKFEDYLNKHFYLPMGLEYFTFNPTEKSYSNKIVPTEIDTLFRKTTVKGWVHDENAALLGGISGNAGLFGSAEDLAKMMLMYQNYGTLNGKRYLSEETVRQFISVQYPENKNRRGLGFDKPLLGNDTLAIKDAYPAPLASKKSFGHSGFTGTFVWADPENQLVFVFLSNRVYPSRSHRKLYEMNIRTAIHQVFYEAKKSM